MKKALLLAMMLCAGTAIWAQKLYFVYIQSDTQSPFYVKMGDKVFSSSASGYLVLSRLVDSSYTLVVGPSANDGELQFSVPLHQKDRGFLLKKFPEGWGLFDMQSMKVIMPENKSLGFSSGARLKEDRFTSLLATAADDTTLFYQPVLASAVPEKKSKETKKPVAESVAEPKKEATAAANVEKENIAVAKTDVATAAPPDTGSQKDSSNTAPADSAVARQETAEGKKDSSAVVAKNESAVTEKKAATPKDETAATSQEEAVKTDASLQTQTEPAVVPEAEQVFKRSKVVRRAESSTVDGFSLVFWDEMDGAVDTIRIFIPNQKFVFADPEAEAQKDGEVKETNAAKMKVPANEKTAAKKEEPKTCSGKASDKDFFRIRKELVSHVSETDMAVAAKNSFRKKCFSAEQIKNLSTLFLTQEGKWLFLEAAFPYVTDKTEFAALQSELREEPYLSRFKALVGK